MCVRERRTKNELVNYRKEVAAQRAKVDAMIAASEEPHSVKKQARGGARGVGSWPRAVLSCAWGGVRAPNGPIAVIV